MTGTWGMDQELQINSKTQPINCRVLIRPENQYLSCVETQRKGADLPV